MARLEACRAGTLYCIAASSLPVTSRCMKLICHRKDRAGWAGQYGCAYYFRLTSYPNHYLAGNHVRAAPPITLPITLYYARRRLHTAGTPESETWHLPSCRSSATYDTELNHRQTKYLPVSVRSDKRLLLLLVGTRSQQLQCDTIGTRKTSSGLRIPSCSRPYALPITALPPRTPDACWI